MVDLTTWLETREKSWFPSLIPITNFTQVSDLRSESDINLALFKASVYVVSGQMIFKAHFCIFSITLISKLGDLRKLMHALLLA